MAELNESGQAGAADQLTDVVRDEVKQEVGLGLNFADKFQRALDGFSELHDQWRNRLIWDELGFVDKYINGDAVICMKYRALDHPSEEYLAVIANFEVLDVVVRHAGGRLDAQECDVRDAFGDDQGPVLIDDVKFVHDPEGAVALGVSVFRVPVRPDLVKDNALSFVGHRTYRVFGVLERGYDVLPCLVVRKFNSKGVSRLVDKREGCVIHRRSKIVDSVSEKQRNCIRYWRAIRAAFDCPGCGIMLQGSAMSIIRAPLPHDGPELVGVYFGPFDLGERAI